MGLMQDDLREQVRSLGILVAAIGMELNEVRGMKEQLKRELLRTKRESNPKAKEMQKVCNAEVWDFKATFQFYTETLAAERAKVKQRRDKGIDKSMQSGVVGRTTMGTQTARCMLQRA